MHEAATSVTVAYNRVGKPYIVRATQLDPILTGLKTPGGKLGLFIATVATLPTIVAGLPVYVMWLQAYRTRPTPAHPQFFFWIIVAATGYGSRSWPTLWRLQRAIFRRLMSKKVESLFDNQTRSRAKLLHLLPAYALLGYYPLVIFAHDRQTLARLNEGDKSSNGASTVS